MKITPFSVCNALIWRSTKDISLNLFKFMEDAVTVEILKNGIKEVFVKSIQVIKSQTLL